MSWVHDREKGGECHKMNCAWTIYKISQVLVIFSGKTLHYSIPMMSLVMSLAVLPNAI